MTSSKSRLVLLGIGLIALGAGAAVDAALAEGRVQASNTLLYQVGRDPTSQEEEGTRFFDHVQLDYLSGEFRFGLRAETYQTSEAGEAFQNVTQKYVEWRRRDLKVRIGNAYATVGRGLLFRAFELPGVIREVNTITDAKYMDSRDLQGAVVEGRYDRIRYQALTGRPLAYPDSPPGLDFLQRREGTVSGGHVDVYVGRGLTLGSGYLRGEGFHFIGRGAVEEYGSMDFALDGGRLFPGLWEAGWAVNLYAEYAGRNWTPITDPFSTADRNPHALYTAAEVAYDRWSLTYEVKDYRDFLLPYNDAPNLVPELAPSLVNRRSHFLVANDERGHLIGLQGSVLGDWGVQYERADARNGEEPSLMRYRLNYFELASPPLEDTRGTLFVAEGRDDLETLSGHQTVGLSLERTLTDGFSATAAVEYQQIERPNDETSPNDVLVSASVSRAGLGSVSLVWEQSNDLQVADDPLSVEVETSSRRWLGLIVQGSIDRNHEVTLFAGKRRGGTACTSGTCYLVPDFSGVEARLISRF